MFQSEIEDIPQLLEEENRILTAGFNEKSTRCNNANGEIKLWDLMNSLLNFIRNFGKLSNVI
jgi:hypothetical protein